MERTVSEETDHRELILANLERVRGRVAEAAGRAGRSPDEVRLVAVSKGQSLADLRVVLEAGFVDLGENRVQELVEKAGKLAGEGFTPEWHMIGRLQRNKVRMLMPWCHIIHSVDRLELGEELARRSAGRSGLELLVEVNVAGEASKAGVAPGDLEGLARGLSELGLPVDGLMTVGPVNPDPEASRPVFRELRRLGRQLAGLGLPGVECSQLSMGMSQDYTVAVEEGATLVRVGTAIFGPRRA